MPKRVIDFDAIWASDKLAHCAPWARAEYTWIYGLADANGSFELSNLRVIFGRAYAIRDDVSIEKLSRVLEEFHAKGLLFIWEGNGKRYGHWTGSDVPGRLPPPSWRLRFERLAPAVPRAALAEYCGSFSNSSIKAAPGGPQAQDLDLDLDQVSDSEGKKLAAAAARTHATDRPESTPPVNRPGGEPFFGHPRLRISPQLDAKLALEFPELPDPVRRAEYEHMAAKLEEAGEAARSPGNYARAWLRGRRSPPAAAARRQPALCELAIGIAPSPSVCGVRVKPTTLARIRARDAVPGGAHSESHEGLASEPKERAS